MATNNALEDEDLIMQKQVKNHVMSIEDYIKVPFFSVF